MSRYIDADAIEDKAKQYSLGYYEEDEWAVPFKEITSAPSIDLADYVPKDFHDKTCEAMAKAHQEEIADMVSVVRCKECKHWHSGNCWGIPFSGDDASYIETESGDFCSYGEREGE